MGRCGGWVGNVFSCGSSDLSSITLLSSSSDSDYDAEQRRLTQRVPTLLGKPWTILKTTHWLSANIHVKRYDLIWLVTNTDDLLADKYRTIRCHNAFCTYNSAIEISNQMGFLIWLSMEHMEWTSINLPPFHSEPVLCLYERGLTQGTDAQGGRPPCPGFKPKSPSCKPWDLYHWAITLPQTI